MWEHPQQVPHSRRSRGEITSKQAAGNRREQPPNPKNKTPCRRTDFSHLITAGHREGEIISALLFESMTNLTVCFLGSSFMSAGVHSELFWNPQCEFPASPRPV